MGIYIGWVERKISGSTVFFNFKPIAEVQQNQIIELTTSDLDNLLPESQKHDINFTYQWNSPDQLREMDANFKDGALTAFEFVLSDLSDNIYNGVRRPTGYMVKALDMLDEGKITKLCTVDAYQVVRAAETSDFYNEPIVEIDVDDV